MAAGKVAETVAVELEQVAGDLEQAASVARRIDGRVMSSFLIGVGVGAAVGFYFGYKYSKRKLRNEIYAEAEKDIETIREHYQQKIIAAGNTDKPTVEHIIAERGYVHDQDTALEAAAKIEYSHLEDPTEAPEPQSIRANVFEARNNRSPRTRMPTTQKDKDEDWNWEKEYVIREDETEPYIIHQNEYEAIESGFAQAAYIYYTKDDILVDEDDPKTILSNEENLVGPKALEKFGHGADDYNTVYVRNPKLELEIEIHRVTESWEEEVLGLDPNETR